MEVDVKPVIPNMDANFVDDDDLQAVLAQSRRRKLNKPKIMTAEEIAEKRKLLMIFPLMASMHPSHVSLSSGAGTTS